MAVMKIWDAGSQSYKKVPILRGNTGYIDPITDKAAGTSISVSDSASAPIQSLRVFGHSEMIGTPSMSAPCEIRSVGGDSQIRARGKNFFNKNDSAYSAIKNETAGGFWAQDIFPNGYDLSRVFPIGETVTLSYDVECVSVPTGQHTPSGGRVGLRFLESDAFDLKWIWMTPGRKEHFSATFEVPQNIGVCHLCAYSNRCTENGEEEGPSASYGQMIFSNIQVELGNKETDNEAYIGYTSVSIPVDALRGIGELRDELIVNADGLGKIVRRLGEYVFTGNERYDNSQRGNRTFYYAELPNGARRDADYPCLCNYFEIVSYNNTLSQGGNASFSSNALAVYPEGKTKEQYRDWLRGLSVPMKVVYKLETPTETALSAEQVRSLLAVRTYKPKSVITADTEIEVEYVCDPKSYIEKKYNEIATALVAQGGN